MLGLPMRRMSAALLAGIVLAGLGPALPASAAAYQFHDEFSGSSLNTAVWTAQTAPFNGVCVSSGNVRVSGGYLRLTVHKGTRAGCPWDGSRVISQDKRYLGYGLVQARVRWNAVQGFWGGFVMFGKAGAGSRESDGEVDTEITNGVVHYRLWSVNAAGKRCGVPIDQPNSSLSQWHTFGVNRQATFTEFYLDGVKKATITKTQMVAKGCTWPFERQFSMVLSARAGGWGGTPDPARYPVTSLVDWVRQ